MDDSRFDVWTRRRFGLAMGGGIASLLGLSALDDARARKNKRKRKKRCKKLKQGCNPGGVKKSCCKGRDLACAEFPNLSGNRCCRKARGSCQDAEDCCGDLSCEGIPGLAGARCCGSNGMACSTTQRCCGAFACDEFTSTCVPVQP
jgi:hypothetical protein